MKNAIIICLLTILLTVEALKNGCGTYKCTGENNAYVKNRPVYKQVQMIDDPRTETVEQMIYTQYYYRDNSLLRTDSDISYEIDSYFAMTEIVENGDTHTFNYLLMDQYIFFYDDYYLQGVDTTPPIKLNARYNLSSSIFDTGKDKTQQFSEERYDNMNMTNGFIIKSKKISIPPLDGYHFALECTKVSDAGCYNAGDSTIATLWIIIIILVCAVVFLLYYQRNYRYLPITSRKRIDEPEDRQVTASSPEKE